MDKVLARMAVILTAEKSISRTALNKLLFFADIAYFLDNNKTISNSKYTKLDYGPVPEKISRIRSYLLREKYVSSSVEMYGEYIQHSYSSNVTKETLKKIRETFDPKELEIIDAVSKTFSSWGARQLSDLSHKYDPWKSADWYEELDFDRALKDVSLKTMLKEKSIVH